MSKIHSAALCFSGLLLSCPIHASGYNFGTQSVSAMSTADASAAEAADAGTIYYNPAGLTKLKDPQISLNLVVAKPDATYKNAEAQYFSGIAVEGQHSGSVATDWTMIPHGYLSWPISPTITAGLGIYVPFGASAEHSRNSVLRYSTNKTELRTLDINPTLAFEINPQHSIGVGIIAQYATAKLRKFADFSPRLAAYGVGAGQADGYAQMEADDWGVGFNVGWMWDINEQARIGASYRSAIDHTLSGHTNWKLNGPAFAIPGYGDLFADGIRASGYVEREGTKAKITTPESVSVHGMYRINPKTNLFGNLTWTRHSRFNKLNIQFDNPKSVLNSNTGSMGQSDTSTLSPNWRDTWRIAIGGSYQISDPLQLRAGFSYDQSPVKSADDRLTTLPDNDRYWFSLGAKYDFNKDSTLNIGYSYLYIDDSSSHWQGCSGACVDSHTSLNTDFESSAHFIGLSYTHRF